jgi:hypothetical protein
MKGADCFVRYKPGHLTAGSGINGGTGSAGLTASAPPLRCGASLRAAYFAGPGGLIGR